MRPIFFAIEPRQIFVPQSHELSPLLRMAAEMRDVKFGRAAYVRVARVQKIEMNATLHNKKTAAAKIFWRVATAAIHEAC